MIETVTSHPMIPDRLAREGWPHLPSSTMIAVMYQQMNHYAEISLPDTMTPRQQDTLANSRHLNSSDKNTGGQDNTPWYPAM